MRKSYQGDDYQVGRVGYHSEAPAVGTYTSAHLIKYQVHASRPAIPVVDLERGVQPLAHEVHPKIFGLPHPFLHVNAYLEVRKEYLQGRS